MAGFMRQPQMINDPSAAPAAMRADDVDLQAQEGDFIMGYPAMRQSGPRVRSLVEQAMLKAKDKGGKTKGYKSGDKVDILVHNGEMHIPKQLVSHIDGGYTTLKKLNSPSKYAVGDYITDRQAMNKETIRRENLRRYIDQTEDITARDFAISGRKEAEDKRKKREDLEFDRAINRDVHHPKEKIYSRMNNLLDESYQSSIPKPEKGAIVFTGKINTKGTHLWNNADKVVKEIFNSKAVIQKPDWANQLLAKEAMHNLKKGIENGVYPNFKSDLLKNKRFLLNIAKTTEMHHLMDKANWKKTGKRLNTEFFITPKGLRVRYEKGTGDLFKSNEDEQRNYINDKEMELDYKFDDNYNTDSNWHHRDGKRILAKHNIKDSGINSMGGTGYSGENHKIKFNKEYNMLFDYLKSPDIEGFKPNIYSDGNASAIGHGHRLTKHEIQQNNLNKEFTDIDTTKSEDLLAKDIMEAEKNVKVVYNNFIKKERFTGQASTPFKDLDAHRRMVLIEMAFNMGASKIDPYTKETGFPKFFKALAHNDYETMAKEYHRKGVSENRNNKFFELFINRQKGDININEPFMVA